MTADVPSRASTAGGGVQRAARVAGFTFLFLMATVVVSMVLFDGLVSADRASTLANVAADATRVRASILLMIVSSVATFVLAVGLYGATRRQGHGLAVFALCCRAGEAALYAIPTIGTVILLAVAEGQGAGLADETLGALGVEVLLRARAVGTHLGALLFSVGSAVYFYLFLRGRLIPVPLAVFGVAASLILIVGIPLQLIDVLGGSVAMLMWIPMFLLEISAGLWLLIKGVRVAEPGVA